MSQAAHTLHDEDPTLASLAPAADGTPALIAGRYEVRDSIGRGAFGEVFEAYDRVLGRLVAVKVMPIAHNLGAEGRESLRRFQVEARAVSRLTHPNIITVHDFGQGERFAWIVMELVIGETLADALRRTGPPPMAETSRILCALLSALHAAHERGIVHRDVKPGNILLEMNLEDGLGEVRLSDFGIARTDAEDRTAVGQMIGTPWVMAPEQLRGEAVDRRTDLWAAGVILYDMLTGERPFKGTMPGIFHRIQHEEPPPPTRLRAELPPAVDALIARALAKAPEDRFATAEEMAAAIRAALTEAPRWQDAPPLPGLDAEEPAARALVPAPPPPLPAPAATPRSRFGQGIAVGMVAGLALGVAASRVAEMSATVAVQAGPPAAEAPAGASGVAAAPPASSPGAPRDVAAVDAPEADAPRRATPAPAAWMPEPAEAIRDMPRASAEASAAAPATGGAERDTPAATTSPREAAGDATGTAAVAAAASPDRAAQLRAGAVPPSAVQDDDAASRGVLPPAVAPATRGDAAMHSTPGAMHDVAQDAPSTGTADHARGAPMHEEQPPGHRDGADGAASSVDGDRAPAPGQPAVVATDAVPPRHDLAANDGQPHADAASAATGATAGPPSDEAVGQGVPPSRVPAPMLGTSAHAEATAAPLAVTHATPALAQPVLEAPRAGETTPPEAVLPPAGGIAAAAPSPARAAQPAPSGAVTPQPQAISARAVQGGTPGGNPPPAGEARTGTSPASSIAAGTAPPPAVTASMPPALLPACGPDRLRIRTGSHDGHGRIVFDWSGPVAYRLTPGAEGLAIAFPDAGCQPATRGIRPARNLQGVAATGQDAGVLLRIAPGAQPRDFRLGNRVVIDLADAAR